MFLVNEFAYTDFQVFNALPAISMYYSGHTLLRDPRYNKGLAFTEQERDAHYIRGLLPPAVLSQELQVTK